MSLYQSGRSGANIDALLDSVDYTILTQKVTPHADDMLLLQDNQAAGIAKKVKISSLPSGSGTTFDIHALTAETALADTDEVPFYDVSATETRKTLWSNIKSVLKNYFDAVYTTALLVITGYSKPGSASALAATDTVNAALGKLEKALDGKTSTTPSVVSHTASYTLALTDAGTIQKCSSASTITVTIPLNSSVAFPTNTEIVLVRYSTGAVTLSATGGVTLNSSGSKKSINAQYEAATLKKIGTDEWLLIGALAT